MTKIYDERAMLRLLRRKYAAESGNGPAYAYIEKVKNDAGHSASRTIDAMVMSLYPSRGLRIYAFEVKCTRKDWLKELREPAKAEAFQLYVDYFYLVVSDPAIVKPGELPETWGLMAPKGPGLGVVVDAPINPDVRTMSRGMLAALLRQAGVEATRQPEEIEDARRAGIYEGRDMERELCAGEIERLKERVGELNGRERELKRRVGVGFASLLGDRDQAFYSAIKAALDGERDVDHLRSRIKRLGDDAKTLFEQADRIMREHFPEEST